MPFKNLRSPAEASDSLVSLTAVGAGIAAIVYSANVIEVFASDTFADIVGYGQIIFGLLILLAYFPSLLFLKARGGRAAGKHSAGGFLYAIMQKAIIRAFNLTIGFLIVLSLLAHTVLSHFTAESMVDLVIAFALASFSISFLMINRFGDEVGNQE